MTQLVKHQSQLPATIEDLNAYVLVGEQQIKAYQAKIRACNKLPDAQKYEAAALREGQAFAETVIIAQAKLGELIAAIDHGSRSRTKEGTYADGSKTLPPGISKKESHKARTIYDNPAVVQQVIAKAKEENRIPTPNEVVKAVNKKPPKPKPTSTGWDFTKAKHNLYVYLRDEYAKWPDKSKKSFRKIVTDILEDVCHD